MSKAIISNFINIKTFSWAYLPNLVAFSKIGAHYKVFCKIHIKKIVINEN